MPKDTTLTPEEKDALFMELNERTYGLIQKAFAYYYNEFYQHVNQVNPNNLLSVIGEDGSLIPSAKRTKKILSLEEIDTLIQNDHSQTTK